MPDDTSSRRVLMLVAAAACWGFGTVITKQVLGDVAPLTLLPLQLLASCVFLATVSLVSRARIRRSPQLVRLTALGILNPGMAYALALLGLSRITASMSVLLWATEPVLIVALAILVLRDHVPRRLITTMAVAVLGVVLVVYQPGASGSRLGVALTLTAVAACALYTVLARRLLLDDNSVTVALCQQAAALCFAVLLVSTVQVLTGEGLALGSSTPAVVAGAAASGVLYYGLAYWFYLSGLRGVSASVAGSFITLVPVFGLAGGYAVGERLDARQWIGATVVIAAIAGVALLQGRIEQPDRRRPGRTPTTALRRSMKVTSRH